MDSPMLTARAYSAHEVAILLNGSLLVGTSYDEETHEVLVGYWSDGEQWTELMRIPGNDRFGSHGSSTLS